VSPVTINGIADVETKYVPAVAIGLVCATTVVVDDMGRSAAIPVRLE
jgi:hypothetical protein